jgi:diguanylate cyclase (GGDEF)-like protein
MDETILNSVIDITQKKDSNSLELSVASVLAELIDCYHLIIYKRLNSVDMLVRTNVNLIIDKERQKYNWNSSEVIKDISPELKSCFGSSCLIHHKLENDKEEAWLPIVINQYVTAVIYIKSRTLKLEQQILLNGFCRIYENYLSILDTSERDKLTGLFNRETFESKVNQLFNKNIRIPDKVNTCKRQLVQSNPSWLVMIDIDHFKNVNDQFGHVCGDEVLLIFSQLLKSFFRKTDLLFRYGGEEFILLMESATQEMINKKLNEFRKYIAIHHFPLINSITISLGYAQLDQHVYIFDIVDRADKALYYVKDNGRNAISCFEVLIEQGLIKDRKELTDSDIELF